VIRHMASIGEIVDDMAAAVAFYRDVLGLEVEWNEGTGYATAKVAGAMHFGIWSREAAAEATLGDKEAASRIPLGFTVEFEVDEVQAAADTLESKGWKVLQAPRTEDWGQTTSRFLSPSGALCGVAETPWARELSGS
jgi:catechol 2,3-dioxygenase-like lactoylglutathione lyase family enzyme